MGVGTVKLKSQSGASALEFAIILPILLLLILGIIEFSFLLFNQAVMTNACREGARAGIVQRSPRLTAPEIDAIVKNYCFNHLITFGGPTIPTVVSDAPCAGFGTDLTVTVTFHYNYLALPDFVASLVGGTDLTTESVMRCE